MVLKSLDEGRAEVLRLASLIGAELRYLPDFGRSGGMATPHIEVDDRAYHWVVQERGKELDRHSTPKLDELLEVTFRSVTAHLATEYAGRHSTPGQDPRRVQFARQLELLERLSPEWSRREYRRQLQTLMAFPYRDGG